MSGYNELVRIENEVAALALAREALKPDLGQLIPRIFGWRGAGDGSDNGWFLQERMSGSSLPRDFDVKDANGKATILGQMADILAGFQRYKLPETIDRFGGVGFDADGLYISKALTTFDVGPFDEYDELIRAIIVAKLKEADANPRVDGWRGNDIRKRLDNFIARGLPNLLSQSNLSEKVLVHADFCKTGNGMDLLSCQYG